MKLRIWLRWFLLPLPTSYLERWCFFFFANFSMAWSIERLFWTLSLDSTHYLTVIPLVFISYLCCHLREDMISRCDILGTDLRNVFYGYHNKIYPAESESEGLWLTYWSLEVCSLFSFFFLIQIVDVLFLKWHYLRSVGNQMATFWVLSAFT